MDRQQLEKLSVSELQDEAKKYGLNPPNDTSRCIDMIMSHLERQATSDLQKRETRAATKSKAMQSTVAATTPTELSDLSQICAWMAQQMRIQQEDKQEQRRIQQEDKQEQRRIQQEQMRIQQEDKQEQRRFQQEQMRFQQEQMRIQQEDKQEQRRIQQEQTLIQQEFQREQARNQQEQQRQNQAMMQQMVELTNLSRENSQNGIRNITSEDNVIRADPDSSITRRQPISSVATAHAVKLLTTQIPEFAGTEEEKIEIWIQTGERIAQIHAVSDDVLLLAASSKLVKNAKRWFDLNVTTLIESWQIFKEAIIRRFKRKILFHVAMQKVEARRWNFPKEQFQDYAMDKLVLMKNLNLPEEDAIHLLINGIGSRSLREAAAVLHCATVDEFLEEMHRITSVSAEPTRKIHHQEIKNDKVKNSEDTVPKDSSVSKSDKDVFCVYCRAKGHVRADCYKLKKKEQSPPMVTAKPASVVSAVEEDVQEMEIATVNEDSGRKLEIPDARIIVTSVNEIPCKLNALLDTGSPVSFIKSSIFAKFINVDLEKSEKIKRYKAVNNTFVNILGSAQTMISLDLLPKLKASISLLVLDNDSFSFDLIIGLDFFKENNISILCKPSDIDLNNRVQLFQEVATTEEIKDKSEDILSLLQDVDTNCNESNKQELEFEDKDNDVAYIEPMPLERELEYKQLRDIKLKNIAKKLEVENNEKFTLIDGLVFHKGKDKPRFVVPEVMINNIIRVYHDDKAHCDVDKTYQGIYENYWYPSLRKKVIDYIDNCLTCMMTNATISTREGELQIIDNLKSPCQIWHTNLFGPISESIEGYKHILVIVDAFTRFTWLFPVKSTSSRQAIKHMELLFNTFGSPNILVSDKGTAFTSNKFSEVMQIHNVKHRQVAVDATWANSIVERVNRFLKASLEKIVEEQQSWSSAIGSIQFVINNTVHSSVKASPSKLLFGYEQRGHSDNELVKNLTQLAKIELKVSDEQDIANELAVEMTDKIKDYNKANYDKQYKKPTQYKEGDYVMIRDTAVKPGEDKKLKPCYKGPYMVTKAFNNNRYVIQDIPGFNVTSRPYNSILSPDKIKYWIKQPEA